MRATATRIRSRPARWTKLFGAGRPRPATVDVTAPDRSAGRARAATQSRAARTARTYDVVVTWGSSSRPICASGPTWFNACKPKTATQGARIAAGTASSAPSITARAATPSPPAPRERMIADSSPRLSDRSPARKRSAAPARMASCTEGISTPERVTVSRWSVRSSTVTSPVSTDTARDAPSFRCPCNVETSSRSFGSEATVMRLGLRAARQARFASDPATGANAFSFTTKGP